MFNQKLYVFAICVAGFLELNCISYFARSNGHNLFESKVDYIEAIGFPFLFSEIGGIAGLSVFQLWAFIANIFIAISISYLVAEICYRKLSINNHGRDPIKSYLFGSIVTFVALFAISLDIPFHTIRLQSVLRDIVRFLGPIIIGMLWLRFYYHSWLWLLVSGIGLFFIAIALDGNTWHINCVTPVTALIAIHAFVPITGLLCTIVLVDASLKFFNERQKACE
jgi:hypothetical protein